MIIREEQKTSILPVIGWLMIGLAVIDFVVSFISYYLFVMNNSKTFAELKLPNTATALVEFIEGHVRILIIIAKYSLTEPIVIIFSLIGIGLLSLNKIQSQTLIKHEQK